MHMIIKTIDENKVCASFLVCMLAWLKQYILHIYNQHTEWFRSQSCCVIKTQQWRISWDPEDKITSPFLSEAHVSQPGGPSVFLKSSPKHGPVGAGVGKSNSWSIVIFFLIGWAHGGKEVHAQYTAHSVWVASLQIQTWMMVICTAWPLGERRNIRSEPEQQLGRH